MELADKIPGFSNTDRLGLTAFGSILAHLVVILGVGFTVPDITPDPDALETLEITLVNTRSDTEPDVADFLAQANQDGGGDSDKPVIARSPLPLVPQPADSEAIPVSRVESELKQRTIQPDVRMLTQTEDETLVVAKVDPQPPPKKAQKEVSKAGLVKNQPSRNERARLSAEISQFWEEYQKRPRRKFLSARTKEYKYATYMEAWRTKVEKVGNLNYPEQARKRKLNGQLVLDVEIRPDGNLHAVSLIRPSGHKELDDAAIRIVQLSAPFEPFPSAIREDVDILHITRTWQFVRGNKLTSR